VAEIRGAKDATLTRGPLNGSSLHLSDLSRETHSIRLWLVVAGRWNRGPSHGVVRQKPMRQPRCDSLHRANLFPSILVKKGVARKLAVILHRMWIEGTEFNWSKKQAAA
jgi:hypothetical protein